MSPLQAIDPGKRYGNTVALEALNLATLVERQFRAAWAGSTEVADAVPH